MQRDENSDPVLEGWYQHVERIPSTFGRLAFLAGLKNCESGRYTHYRLKSVLDEEETDRIIRKAHLRVFAEWLSYTLAQQQTDLNVFLAGVEGHRRQILAACAVLAPHVWCIPEGVAEHERRLYLADLEAILEPLYNQYGLSATSWSNSPMFGGFGTPQWGPNTQ